MSLIGIWFKLKRKRKEEEKHVRCENQERQDIWLWIYIALLQGKLIRGTFCVCTFLKLSQDVRFTNVIWGKCQELMTMMRTTTLLMIVVMMTSCGGINDDVDYWLLMKRSYTNFLHEWVMMVVVGVMTIMMTRIFFPITSFLCQSMGNLSNG